MTKTEGVYTVRTERALNAFTYVVGVIGFLSVVRYVGPVFSVPFVCMLGAALYFDYRKRYTVYRTPLNIALVVFIGLNFLRISLNDFAAPIVEVLLILLAVKLIEEKKARDYLQIYVLSVFLLTGSALMSLDIQFMFMLLILVFLLPVGIVLLTFHSQQGNMMITNMDLRRIVSRALVIAVVCVPVTALLFVVLPRTGFPMFKLLARGGMSGFTDTVRLGEISDIQGNNAAIFRVSSERVDPAMLYWRGVALDHFDGVSWKSINREAEARRHGISGSKVYQVIYLEPYGNRYLFTLDKPVSVQYRNADVLDDLTIRARQNVDRLTRYGVLSVLSDRYAQDGINRTMYLQLPDRDFSRVKKIAEELSAGKAPEAAAQAILQYLKRGQFSYSLKNLPITSNPVEDFLLIHKYGNCEYFASSMAVLLRLAGIPSRLVGGYMGGQYNDYGKYYLVTQNNAHVWVEAYIYRKGWVRFDPTPAAAGAPAVMGRRSFWRNAGLYFDLINYYWNVMVIDYNLDKQISVYAGLRNMFRTSFNGPLSAGEIMPVLGSALVVSAIIIPILLFIKRKRSAEKRLVTRFVAKMKRRGYEKLPYEGLEEFARRADDPLIREKALRFASGFGGIYYRDRKMTGKERSALKHIIDDI
jgi:protein-glutamine gamma-glutamyltransferase